MTGAEESGWSERRTRALFKYIFRIVWAPRVPFLASCSPPENGGLNFEVEEDGRGRWHQMTKCHCRVAGQWVRGAWHERCVVQRAEGARLAENWLVDP